MGELWYGMIDNMVNNVLGPDGKKFFPLVFSLFSFVLVANMHGMFPYFFTVTSHVIVTASLALFVVASWSSSASGSTVSAGSSFSSRTACRL